MSQGGGKGPETGPGMAQNMRQNALRRANAACPVCGAGFIKKRRWQAFCSQKCRKAHWEAERKNRPAYDIRARLDELIGAVHRIEHRLRIAK